MMRGVYAAVLLLGAGFLRAAFAPDPVHARTAVQAVIFIVLGAGGLIVDWRRGFAVLTSAPDAVCVVAVEDRAVLAGIRDVVAHAGEPLEGVEGLEVTAEAR